MFTTEGFERLGYNTFQSLQDDVLYFKCNTSHIPKQLPSLMSLKQSLISS